MNAFIPAPSATPFPLRPLIAALLIGLAMPPAALAADAGAGSATAARHYDIPAGTLAETLGRFAGAADVTLAFDAAQLDGLRSPGLRGSHTVTGGFARLLDGSGFEAIPTAPGRYGLRRRPAGAETTLAPVRVTARAEADATTEGSGAYTATGPSRSATGLALSQRETPQSVSVVTRQQIEDFNLITLQDIARVTPGVYLKNAGISDQESQAYTRGFAIQQLNVDGLPLSTGDFNNRSISADMAMYDRVEVVRGATGLLQGAGTPSGTINLVRKRPTPTPLLNLSASIGRWDNKQLSIDASNALNEAATLRGRVVAAGGDGSSFVDVTHTRNATLYGVLEADLGSATQLGIGAYRQRTHTDGLFRGLPTDRDGRHMGLPRATYLDTPDSFQQRDNDGVFADLEHRLGNGWTLKAAATHVEASSDSRYTYNGRITGSDTLLSSPESGWRYGTRQNVIDLRASGPVEVFGRRHELIVGASYREDDATWAETWGGTGEGRIVDIFQWNPSAHRLTGAPATNPLMQARSTREKGLYAAGNFHLADPLHLVLGGRLGWYTQDGTGWYTGTPAWKRGLDADGQFVPYAGLVYDLDKHHSAYASVTEIFQPQSSIDARGKALAPLTGTNYELGVKGEYFGGTLNAHAAVFQIRQNNRPVRDEASCPTGGLVTCYRAAGQVESNGVELQLAGTLAPGWQLSAGYTYVSAKYTRDAVASNIGQRIATDEPRQLFKLYTSYRLPGEYQRWSINGLIQAQDRIYRKDSASYTVKQAGYALVGIGAAYRVDSRLQLQLNVDNLFDKAYYSELGYSWGAYGDRYGTPRNVVLTARYSFF